MSQERGTGLDLVTTRDGRSLGVEVTGSERGSVVFLLHGTPGSRTGPKPRSSVLHRLGVRLVCFDRPGYGRSARLPGRTVADVVDDVCAIADHFGYDTFSVLGRSGGGPHALACAALLPDRVVRTAVLVSVAPPNAPGLDWYEGMTPTNADEYRTSDTDIDLLTKQLQERAEQVARDPLSLLQFLNHQMTESDRYILEDVAIRRLFTDSYREALRDGRPDGWLDDVLALRRPWGFSLGAIRRPVALWHGAEDTFAPWTHTRWLGERIPEAQVFIESGVAHFGAVDVLPSFLSWLASPVEAATAVRRTDLVGLRTGAGRLLDAGVVLG